MQTTAAPDGLSLNLIEASLTAVAFAAAFAWPRLGSSLFLWVERGFDRLASRKGIAVFAVGIAALLMRLAMLPLRPIPLPVIPDDFSFLLAADTFAHGRLANPTPAMWIHFESLHIDMQPTYMSMYFPGQGLLLAAGKILFGQPWFAVVLVSALMCAAICWMLQAWLPPSWALLGGLIALLRLSLFSYWSNTYHSAGCIAALGGAMLLGALPRFMRAPGTRLALTMAVGMILMASTRPFEGMLLCLPVLAVLLRWLLRAKARPAKALLMKTVPAAALFVAAAIWMGYYDSKVFGNPLTLPYTVNRATYAVAPYYVWQAARPEPAYRHEEMRRFYVTYEASFYKRIHSFAGFFPETLKKFFAMLAFFAGFALLPPFIMARRVLLDRRTRFLVLCVAVLAAGLLIENFILPHYVAPVTAALYALGLQAGRHLRQWRPGGQKVGVAITRFAVLICLVMCGLRLFNKPLHFYIAEWPVSAWNDAWFGPDHFGTERANVEAELDKLPGSHLVLVRYSPQHDPGNEWVYNNADIDGSKVVWARDMSSADNLELIRYYPSRKVWLVEPDTAPAALTPYPTPALGSTASNQPAPSQVAAASIETGMNHHD